MPRGKRRLGLGLSPGRGGGGEVIPSPDILAHFDFSALPLSNDAAFVTAADLTGNQSNLDLWFGSVTYATGVQNGLGMLNMGGAIRGDFLVLPAQPYTILLVVKFDTTDSQGNPMTLADSKAQFFVAAGIFDLNCGTDLAQPVTRDTDCHVVELYCAGASSALTVDGVTIKTGNAGNAAGTGAKLVLAGNTTPCHFGECIVMVDDSRDFTIGADKGSKWGLTYG